MGRLVARRPGATLEQHALADDLSGTEVAQQQIAAIVEAVAPKPVNVLVSGPIGLSVADLEALGVRRVSVGGALARAAWGGFLRAATEIAERGTFEALADGTPHATLQKFFRDGSLK